MKHPVDPLQAPRSRAQQYRLPTARRRGAALLVLTVLLAHALLLQGRQRAAGAGADGAAPRALQVRQIARLDAPDEGSHSLVATAPVPPSSTQGRRPPARVFAPVAAPLTAPLTPRRTPPLTPPHTAPAVAPPSAATDRPTGPFPAENRINAEAGADPGHEAQPQPVNVGDRIVVPVYATRLPPPLVAHYELRRGGAGGSAELQWSAQDGRYALSLRGGLGGAPGFGWDSHGTLDGHGIAPERYTESRRGRELRAANFRREAAAITFSGPPVEQPLLPGTQDRLSWMLQLAAVMQADPALARGGQQIVLFVAGSRGDAAVWVFDVLGLEAVEVADGITLQALRLRRNPERLYDTAVDIWLDPSRHHLPVRVRLALRQGGAGTELLLRRFEMP